jgi:hypothetical protein
VQKGKGKGREEIRDEARERREQREREYERELAEQAAMTDELEGYLKEARKQLGIAEPAPEKKKGEESELEEGELRE